MIRLGAIAGVVFSVALSPGAHADAPTGTAVAQAKLHFDLGNAYLKAGQFDKAADEYLTANRTFPSAAFLYNVAEAYRAGGRKKDALGYYQDYLRAEPHGARSEKARALVDGLTIALAEEARQAAVEAEKTKKTEPVPVPTAVALLPPPTVEKPIAPAPMVEQPIAPPTPPPSIAIKPPEETQTVPLLAPMPTATKEHARRRGLWLGVGIGAAVAVIAAVLVAVLATQLGTNYTAQARSMCVDKGCILVGGGP